MLCHLPPSSTQPIVFETFPVRASVTTDQFKKKTGREALTSFIKYGVQKLTRKSIVRGKPPPSPGEPRDDGGLLGSSPAKLTCQGLVPAALFTSDLLPSTCDKLVTTIPIALHRETTPVMNNAAASVSTSTGGLLSLTEPTMEIQNREDPKRRDQPPCSIPPTGRGHPGVCAEPLRLDDGGWFTSPDFSEVASRATAATRPAFSGAPLVVLFVYISI